MGGYKRSSSLSAREKSHASILIREISFAHRVMLRFSPGNAMTAEELSRSAATDPSPPSGLSIEAQSLWHARAGNWDTAHDLCQEVPGKAGAWIHAWLHRKEGDNGNAGYWYSRAGREMPEKGVTLEKEWEGIASELLS